MLNQVPLAVNLLFIVITFFTVFLIYRIFYNSNLKNTNHIIIIILIFIGIQALLSLNSVYSNNTDVIPPKIFIFGIMPVILATIILFCTKTGRNWIDRLNLESLCDLNIIRIPVEISLYLLFLFKAVPEVMTFEGKNYDILAGITAPIISYYGIKKNKLSTLSIIAWNIICLFLLVNIIGHAFLSTPSPLQKIGFDQPNVAILYFPFSWLATFIAPIVLIGHLISIRLLMKKIKD